MSVTFFTLTDRRTASLSPVSPLDHSTIMDILADRRAPSHILTKDVEEWRDQAKHGDSFQISYGFHLIALDVGEYIGLR